jgi:hypothetical protein
MARNAGSIGADLARSFCAKPLSNGLRRELSRTVNQARRFSPWSQAFYEQQKQAGKSHQKAIRALAYKWGRILWRCWLDRTPYDEAKYSVFQVYEVQ